MGRAFWLGLRNAVLIDAGFVAFGLACWGILRWIN